MAGKDVFKMFTDEVSSNIFHHKDKGKEGGEQSGGEEGENRGESAFNLVTGTLGNLFFKDRPSSSSNTHNENPVIDSETKSEAYRLASSEAHERLKKFGLLKENGENREAAFELLNSTLAGYVSKSISFLSSFIPYIVTDAY